MTHTVIFSARAVAQLAALFDYLERSASPDIAERYVSAIVDHCESLKEFPARSIRRDDLVQGLHLTHYRSRAVVAYVIEEDKVSILGVFYGGQDYEARLRDQV